jgi:hypothetical protein
MMPGICGHCNAAFTISIYLLLSNNYGSPEKPEGLDSIQTACGRVSDSNGVTEKEL